MQDTGLTIPGVLVVHPGKGDRINLTLYFLLARISRILLAMASKE